MKFRRILTPAILIVTLLVQFLPGTVFGPRPVAATACDAAQFMGDITIPDGTSFAPGAALIKTWRFKNIGTCTWSTSYAIVFYSGTKMGAPSVVNLTTSVAPGATVDVTVNMTAPTTPGHYRGYWMLRNASNVLFGVGPYGTYWFFIDIVVTGSYTAGYDFVAHCSDANWTSGAGALTCPGTDGSASGYVLKSTAPQLEDGTSATMPGLIVAPNNVTDGYISGTYPAIPIQSGDQFQTIVSCQYGVSSCYVTFRLDYQIDSGPVYTLWSFREKTEGLYYRANVNLSSLAGHSVKFTLKVMASGSPAGDRVVWGGARIVSLGGTTPPPLVTTCDKAAFVSDVTIPDGTVLAAGTSFTKTWRLQNVGSCTWTTSYKLVFAGGDYMGVSASAFNLATSVAPGGTIDLSVNLTAPITVGNFYGYWRLQNASGTNFGVGASGTSTFFVYIKVLSSVTPSPGPSPTPTPTFTPTPTTTIVGPSADLSVTINDGLSTYALGGTATYTVVVSNGGPSAVTGAGVSIPKPSNITSWTAACVAESGASCTAIPASGGTITDSVTIPVGKKVTYTISASISGVAVGNLVTTATVTNPGATPDPNIANNSATDTDAPPSADLSITITDGVSTWTPGGSTTYMVVVMNSGPLGVTGAVFTDNKPTRVTTWSWTCTPDAGATCGVGSGGPAGNITDSANIPAGKKVIYMISASLLSTTTPGDLVNIVTIAAPGGTPDPVSTNNSATDTDTGPSADLAVVTNTDGVTFYAPSGTLNYTIRVFNNGPYAVTGATFTDNKPSQIASWTWACVHDTNSTCTAVPPAGGNVTDSINLAVGEGVTYTVVATVTGGATGSLANTATVAPPISVTDPVSSNDSLTDTDFHQNADLAVTMTDGVTTYTAGGTVTYTIIVTNNGPSNVPTTVSFSDQKPTQVSSWTWSLVASGGATSVAALGVVAGDFGDNVTIPVGGRLVYTVVVTTVTPATGSLINIVTINIPQAAAYPDPDTTNNTVTDTNTSP
jgi:uncharacterized repeat protein (TIGR01451 family)